MTGISFQVGFSEPENGFGKRTKQRTDKEAFDFLQKGIQSLREPITSVVDDAMLERNADLFKYLSLLPDGELFKRTWMLYQDFQLVLAEHIAYKKQIERGNKQKSELIAEMMKQSAKKSGDNPFGPANNFTGRGV